MKKKLFSLCLITVMIFIMLPIGCFARENESELNQSAEENILSTYQNEIELVETICGHPIEHITATTRKEIASVANHNLYHPSYRFSELMTAIAYASALSNTINDIQSLSTTDIEIIEPYGPISGKFIDSLPTGSSTTLSDEISVGVTINFFEGFNLSGNRSTSVSYSFSGPPQGATLFNGMRATHNYACAIMYGTVMRNGDRYYIDDLVGEEFVSLAAVTAKGNLYVDAGAADYDSSGYWVNRNTFEDYLYTHPEFYLRGNS